jgi:hypothetical protein
VGTSPSTTATPGHPYLKGGDSVAPRTGALDFFSFFFFFLSCTPAFLWPIKGKAWHPAGGGGFFLGTPLEGSDFQPTKGTSTPLHVHQRPGRSSLSRLFVTPVANQSASNTSNLPLDVGIFSLNQYTFSFPLCIPSEPKRAIIKIYLPVIPNTDRKIQ